MNSHVILTLSIGFAVLAFLLLCICLFSTINKKAKLLLVIVTSAAYFISFDALKMTQGWATPDSVPAKFVLLAAVIEEPVKDKTKGEIFVWLQELVDNKPQGEPRAFRFPYEKGLHSLFEDGIKKTRNGNSQIGSLEPLRGPKSNNWLRSGGDEPPKVRLGDLPAPQLPEK